MDADLEKVYRLIADAIRAEDVFGSEDVVLPADTLLEHLHKKYEALKSGTNPKAYKDPEDAAAAGDADSKLNRFYEEAQRRISQGCYGIPGYGRPRPVTATRSFRIGPTTYFVGPRAGSGSRTTLYQAFMEREGVSLGEVLIKLANEPAQNHLAHREVRNLSVLHEQGVPQWKHLPYLMDKFDSGSRVGVVMRKFSGFTLTQVRQHPAHKEGADQRHMVWILDRTLSCLGYVHRQGLAHGCINPDHIMVRPEDHNALICGWGNAVLNPAESGEGVETPSELFSAPEVRENGEIGPWSDIYSLGKTMIWLLGGDPLRNELPDDVETEIKKFLRQMVRENQHARPADAWELYTRQCAIKDALWPRRFLHFEMG